ncbi:hypothetical protein NDI39_27435 [Microcoleus sp. ZQ-A2]|nr:hypothetical protein [Microcoleus sp. FACHB-1]
MKGILARLVPAITLVPLTILLLAENVLAETLKTKSFNVTITRNCLEESVTCDNVTYVSRDLNTGNSIRLKGKTLHRMCADMVTPCRFLGYEFRNKGYRYLVTVEGTLQVFQGKKVVVNEKGTWLAE